MSAVLWLHEPLECETPLGRGWAIIWQDPGFHQDDVWRVVLSESKRCVAVENRDIKFLNNFTFRIGGGVKDIPVGS